MPTGISVIIAMVLVAMVLIRASDFLKCYILRDCSTFPPLGRPPYFHAIEGRMSEFPLAQLRSASAFCFRDRLFICAEGQADGAGSQLFVRRSYNKIFPREFFLYAIPGNPGTVPNAPPVTVATIASYFDRGDVVDEIQVTHAGGSTIVPVGVATDGDVQECSAVCGDWIAIQNMMPGASPNLHVKGTLLMPTPGYTLTLRLHEPQGINPAILLLVLTITPPTGIVPQLVTPTPVEYRADIARPLTEVSILPDNVIIPVKVVHLTSHDHTKSAKIDGRRHRTPAEAVS
jgi:hypothetical protein